MANPIISRTTLATSAVAMSVRGVVSKTAFLLSLAAVSGFGVFFYALSINVSSSLLYAMKPHLAKSLAIPYALIEGVLLGAFSLIMYRYYPSVPLSALSATFITAAVMLTLYATGIIKVTEKFRAIVTSAVIAIGILYLVQLGFHLFGSSLPLLFDGGMVAIGFSVFVIFIASLKKAWRLAWHKTMNGCMASVFCPHWFGCISNFYA